MSVLALGFVLAVSFFVLNRVLRRRGDERLYRRVTLVLIAVTFVIVATIIVAIQLGLITDHYP
jgi:predicted PurR-regulated permease PerM